MGDEWYYGRDQQQHGPVSRAGLEGLAASGDLRPGDLVWREGMAEWVPASRVRGLMPPVDPSRHDDRSPPARRQGRGEGVLWHLLALLGVVAILPAFFLPWWGAVHTLPSKTSERNALSRAIIRSGVAGTAGDVPGEQLAAAMEAEVAEADRRSRLIEESQRWARHYLGSEKVLAAFKRYFTGREGMSFRVWGWHSLPGVLGLVTAALAGIYCVVVLSVAPARRWAWVGLFVLAIPSTAVFVLSLQFLLECPQEGISEILAQGVWPGAYLSTAGGAVLAAATWAGAVVGLIRFLGSPAVARLARS